MSEVFNGGKLNFFNYQPMTWSATKRATFKAINNAYRATAEVRRGELTTYNNADVAVFTRATPEHKMLVMVNTTDEDKTVKTPITLAGETMTDLINGGDKKMPTVMSLSAYGYVIYMK